ncbi:MAG: acyl-CoA thioesterase [Georgenia sp.]
MARLTIPVQVRWSDTDGYNHVNNAKMLTILEEARIAVFWGDSGVPHASGTQTLLARQEIEYLSPLEYSREPVQVEIWVSHLGGASLDVCYEVIGPDGVAARAMTTLVMVDLASGRPRRLTEEERGAWSPLLGEPVPFRRRRAGG